MSRRCEKSFGLSQMCSCVQNKLRVRIEAYQASQVYRKMAVEMVFDNDAVNSEIGRRHLYCFSE